MAITAQYCVCGCRPVSVAADMAAAAESSATEETASDASYSADELREEHAAPTLHHNRGSMPSSKEWHCMSHSVLVMLVDRLDCCSRPVCCHGHISRHIDCSLCHPLRSMVFQIALAEPAPFT